MIKEEMETLINSMREKLGTENAGLIADDLGRLMTENTNMNNELSNKDNKINKLQQEKDNLLTVNGNLLQQVAMGEEIPLNKQKEDTTEKKKFSFKSCFDEKGNFK